MNEDQQLSQIEQEWKNKFERFTTPSPTTENTLQLIEKIKNMEVEMPMDIRAELEMQQSTQTVKDKMVTLFLSQWNFHGVRSWLLTGILMLVLTITIQQNMQNDTVGFHIWIKWMTLIVIAGMGYAFRSKNEGNAIIETLSYYPLIQQMFARFIIVMGLQIAIALPLLFVIVGSESMFIYIVGMFTPLFFFGVVGFVSSTWFGQKVGLSVTLVLWGSQVFIKNPSLSLFLTKENTHFMLINFILMVIAISLLNTIRWRFRRSEMSL